MHYLIELPWPSRDLHPNARKHWAPAARAKRAARIDGFYAARAVKANGAAGDRFRLTYTFCPPDNRKRDDDGLAASMKSYRDGIADAMRVDDSCFITGQPEWGHAVKGGAVFVRIEPQEEPAIAEGRKGEG